MANPWFRLYAEFDDDPKVVMMPEAMQARLIRLMCQRCKEQKLTEEQRAYHWRLSLNEMAETKKLFLAQGFIDEKWNLINWNARQFLSDSSTDRTRRYRQKKKQGETSQDDQNHEDIINAGTGGNVTCDAGDGTDSEQIQNRTDSEQRQSIRALAKTEAGNLSQAVNQEAHEDLTEWVELIAVAHPKGRLKNLSRREVPVGDRAAIIDAIILEAAKQGVSTAEAGKQLLAIVESLAETVPRVEWQYIKAIPYYFAEFEYRRDPETFKRSSGARGGASNGKRRGTDGNDEALREFMAGQAGRGYGHPGFTEPVGGRVREDAEPDDIPTLHGSAGRPDAGTDHPGVQSSDGGVPFVLPKPSYPPRVQWPRRNG